MTIKIEVFTQHKDLIFGKIHNKEFSKLWQQKVLETHLTWGKHPKSDHSDSLAVITNRNQHFHEENQCCLGLDPFQSHKLTLGKNNDLSDAFWLDNFIEAIVATGYANCELYLFSKHLWEFWHTLHWRTPHLSWRHQAWASQNCLLCSSLHLPRHSSLWITDHEP